MKKILCILLTMAAVLGVALAMVLYLIRKKNNVRK